MNVLSGERKLEVLHLLAEGNSIRSIERLHRNYRLHRDTVMRLLVDTGNKCREFLDQRMRNLAREHWEIDEIWTFCRKKEAHLTEQEKAEGVLGDQYLFIAIGKDTKLAPAFVVGKRNRETTREFLLDLASRLQPSRRNRRPQLSTDGFAAYPGAVDLAFGADVDYGFLVKDFQEGVPGPGRYGPPDMVGTYREVVSGTCDPRSICTSHVERNNLTIRTLMRRYVRLSLGFSKKLENLRAAIALHLAHYNFCWQHSSLGTTPAMVAGLEQARWSLGSLLQTLGVIRSRWG